MCSRSIIEGVISYWLFYHVLSAPSQSISTCVEPCCTTISFGKPPVFILSAGMNTETPKQLSEPSNFGGTWEINHKQNLQKNQKKLRWLNNPAQSSQSNFGCGKKRGMPWNPLGEDRVFFERSHNKVNRHSIAGDLCYKKTCCPPVFSTVS
jgi:hypothetical protein